MTQSLEQQLKAKKEEEKVLQSIRTQVASEIAALNEQGKTPMEMATAMIEKLVQARYRMLQLDKMVQHLRGILDKELREMSNCGHA